MDGFWAECTRQGVVSKQLAVHRTPTSPAPVGLCVGEAVKDGAPLISVPYHSVLNGQTLRGDLLPRALPPLRKSLLFLTRRGRLGSVTAHSLWLAAFLACAGAARVPAGDVTAASRHAPLLTSAVYPPLPDLFTPAHACGCASLRRLSPTELHEAGLRAVEEVGLTHAMIRHYATRRGVPRSLCPSVEAVTVAYRTVLQRAVLLPWNCEPSAPMDLSELLESSPDLALLPSLVPVIDMIGPAPLDVPVDGASTADGEAARRGGNCLLFTCVQSDFLSSASRRRVIVETSPLASRRVVVCAAGPLKEGEELRMDFE